MPEYQSSFIEILESIPDPPDSQEHYDIAEDVAQAIYERLDDLPAINMWEAPLRNFFALYELNCQVGNGGFAQASYNVPELFPLAEQAFIELGCNNAAKLCRQAIEILPQEIREHSEKLIDQATDIGLVFEHFEVSEMANLDAMIPDEFWVEERLSNYVLKNRQHFLSLDNPS